MTTIGITAPRVVSSEWRKQVSLRSTWWTWAVLVLAVATGVTNSVGVAVGALTPNPDEIGPLGGTLSGLSAAEIVVVVLGVLAVTGEYATGAVRSSFTAVPARTPVVLAKAAVVGVTVLGLSAVLLAGTFAANRMLLATAGYPLPWTGPGIIRALAGTAVYLSAVALLASAVGWLLRSTAGAIGLVVGIIYVLPVIGLMLPESIAGPYLRLLPSGAGAAMREPLRVPEMLPAWGGFLVIALWVAVFLAAAIAVVRRRDV
jgi:ABC-2 type transport system permease protein